SGSAFRYAAKSLKKDREIVMVAVKTFGCALEFADKSLLKDKEIVLATVKQNGNVIQAADTSLKKDREIVLAAVKQDQCAFKYADKSLKKDKEIVLEAVKQEGWNLEYADKSLKKDKEVVLAAVKREGWYLEYADGPPLKDKEVVMAAVKKSGSALEYADKSLRKDKEIVMAAVKDWYLALQYADKSLKKDKEFVLEAVKSNGYALEYADKSLKKDREIVMAAIKQNEGAIQYANKEIRSDKVFMKKNITDKSLLERFFIDNKNLIYNYEIAISGSGGFQIFFDISKAAYEYYCDDDELLESHIFDDEEVPEEFSIGGWHDLCEGFDLSISEGCYELGCCSLTIDSVDSVDESYSLGLNEKELKDLGVKIIREKQTTMDELVKPGEIKYFFSGTEEHQGTWTYKLKTKEPFDSRKLEMTVCEVESREMVTSVWYDYDDKGEEFELIGGDGDYGRTLEVVEVDKTQVDGKLKKGHQEIRYFEFKDAHSSKFWEVSVAGSTVTVRYGKIGTNGQTSVKELDSPEQAQEHATKQAAGKLKKGYQELQKNAEGC
ncbi:MAG: DUF4116 domain-containing protein, partial [Candidatus Pacebacteria bacterium]|nr:DUF4116 domain-containing protein [Candidatus Paceibacterota bacterium]